MDGSNGTLVEINFDGIIGPSHNYAGLSLGNLASARNAGGTSHPRAAALQGLARDMAGQAGATLFSVHSAPSRRNTPVARGAWPAPARFASPAGRSGRSTRADDAGAHATPGDTPMSTCPGTSKNAVSTPTLSKSDAYKTLRSSQSPVFIVSVSRGNCSRQR